jgi:copper chaperone CopZ
LQITLYAPDISCDHCIATIERTVGAHEGARFLSGNIEARRFSIDVEAGVVLDAVAVALAAEGYPLGPADEALEGVTQSAASASAPPVYRVKPSDAGAEINYDCPCGCVAGFAYNRALAAQDPESCCCGRTMLVGREATASLRTALEGTGEYTFDIQTVTMPWGQPVEAALAVPVEPPSEH